MITHTHTSSSSSAFCSTFDVGHHFRFFNSNSKVSFIKRFGIFKVEQEYNEIIFPDVKNENAEETAGLHLQTCWAEPEPSISQDQEQKSGAEELGEAQREVSELRVRVIPAVARNAAEAPQQALVQPGPDREARTRRAE